MPSFEELFPGLRGDDSCDGSKRKKFIGMDYYQVLPMSSFYFVLSFSILGCDEQPWPGSLASARQLHHCGQQAWHRDQSVQLPHQCRHRNVFHSNNHDDMLQAYSDNSIEEMREQKEKGGMDNMEMIGC